MVVIAILAAITIVAYNGISGQARVSVLKSELTSAAKKLSIAKVESGSRLLVLYSLRSLVLRHSV